MGDAPPFQRPSDRRETILHRQRNIIGLTAVAFNQVCLPDLAGVLAKGPQGGRQAGEGFLIAGLFRPIAADVVDHRAARPSRADLQSAAIWFGMIFSEWSDRK